MKRIAYLLGIAMMTISLSNCGKDDSGEEEPKPQELAITSVSIAEGSTIPASTEKIEVVYNQAIVLNTRVQITLNGVGVSTATIEDGKKIVARLNLEEGSSYIFNIPGNAVTAVGSTKFAPSLTVNFKTDGKPADDSKVIDTSLLEGKLTNSAATAEAKSVYSLLVENYGKKQFSGAMGEVAWGSEFCDLIYKTTGKYPAIVGFDYIHIAYSPANWIDYGNITPVKDAWESGSIPAMTWHWNLPKSKGNTSLSFNSEGNDFKASNVLVEGTWENEVARADVEKVAGYLKLLQDANIPVLWRPFHEAAGDYTWGSWFWWGNSGVETTKELWKWLRNKLEKEYGLNNLVWVWTVQTSDEGKLADIAKIKAAYPGDDTVDIVGADLYQDSFSNGTANFKLLYKLVEGKKIVTLSECGNLLDVESAFKDGALWSYFMGWYDLKNDKFGFNEWNTKGEWKTIMDNPLVLNRGDYSL